MALTSGGNIADWVWGEHLRLLAESAEAERKFWECQAAVERGEMTCELVWSDDGDLSYMFTPARMGSPLPETRTDELVNESTRPNSSDGLIAASVAPPLDLCECGHSKSLHWMHFGGPGSCSATVDTRHPAAGGDTLTPCKCKGYIPLIKEPIR